MNAGNFEVMNEDFEPVEQTGRRTRETLLETAARMAVENPSRWVKFPRERWDSDFYAYRKQLSKLDNPNLELRFERKNADSRYRDVRYMGNLYIRFNLFEGETSTGNFSNQVSVTAPNIGVESNAT